MSRGIGDPRSACVGAFRIEEAVARPDADRFPRPGSSCRTARVSGGPHSKRQERCNVGSGAGRSSAWGPPEVLRRRVFSGIVDAPRHVSQERVTYPYDGGNSVFLGIGTRLRASVACERMLFSVRLLVGRG